MRALNYACLMRCKGAIIVNKIYAMKELVRTLAILALSCFPKAYASDMAVYEGAGLNSQRFQELQVQLQGKSLESIVAEKGVDIGDVSIERKEKAQHRFIRTYGEDGVPDINVYRRFLIKETLGLYPDTDNFVVDAQFAMANPEIMGFDIEKQSYLNIFWREKSKEIGTDASDFAGYRMKAKDAILSTRNAGNSAGIYQNPTVNVLTGSEYRLSVVEQQKMEEEAKGCAPNVNKTGGEKSALRQEVMKCFQKFDDKFFRDMGYGSSGRGVYDGLGYVNSLVNNNGDHKCMASYYAEGVWITAAHCVGESLLGAGLYIIANGIKFKIEKSKNGNVSLCKASRCDVAFINAPTPKVDELKFVADGDLKLLNAKTPILIPGIEEGSPVVRGATILLNENLLWAPVAKGYCRAYRVEKGCLSHTCSTLSGFSGAPVYLLDNKFRINLVGIHSGEKSSVVSCKAAGTSYAVSSQLFKG